MDFTYIRLRHSHTTPPPFDRLTHCECERVSRKIVERLFTNSFVINHATRVLRRKMRQTLKYQLLQVEDWLTSSGGISASFHITTTMMTLRYRNQTVILRLMTYSRPLHPCFKNIVKVYPCRWLWHLNKWAYTPSDKEIIIISPHLHHHRQWPLNVMTIKQNTKSSHFGSPNLSTSTIHPLKSSSSATLITDMSSFVNHVVRRVDWPSLAFN